MKIGETVQFKDWDELVEQYGITIGGNIPSDKLGVLFSKSMKYLCGTAATINDISGDLDEDRRRIRLANFTTTGATSWTYTIGMVKPVNLPPKLEWEDVFLGGKP